MQWKIIFEIITIIHYILYLFLTIIEEATLLPGIPFSTDDSNEEETKEKEKKEIPPKKKRKKEK